MPCRAVKRYTKRVKKCPMCGSTDLYLEAGGVTGYIYHCNNCEYIGAFVVEEDIEWTEEDDEESTGDTEKKEKAHNDASER